MESRWLGSVQATLAVGESFMTGNYFVSIDVERVSIGSEQALT